MKLSLIIFIILLASQVACDKNNPANMNPDSEKLTYLALGDSYTIGEGVEEPDRYPNQTVALLEREGIEFESPQIIARTGWTTDELQNGISNANIDGQTYDLVTVLIGVNNQFRGRPLINYGVEFEMLLRQAIDFAEGDPNRVVVLSIPDWGITPFAIERGTDQEKVAREIDSYNQTKASISQRLGVHYIDITEDYRRFGADDESLVSDKLHPSGLVYKSWAEKLVGVIREKMDFRK